MWGFEFSVLFAVQDLGFTQSNQGTRFWGSYTNFNGTLVKPETPKPPPGTVSPIAGKPSKFREAATGAEAQRLALMRPC